MSYTKITNRIREEGTEIGAQFKEKTFGYILTALGLVVGLAWNEVIKSAIDAFWPIGKDGLLAKLIYAIIITLLMVIITVYLSSKLKVTKK